MRSSSALPLLREILFTRFSWRLLMIALAALSTCFGLLGPLFQKAFLDRLSHSDSFSWVKLAWLQGLAPETLLWFSFLSLLLSLALYQAVVFLGTRESLWMQRELAQRMYQHTLHLRTDSLHNRSVGEIVSIYTIDVPGATILLDQSLPQGLNIFFPLIFGPWLLIEFFDIPFWSLAPLLMGIFILNFFLAFRQSRFFFRFKRLAAERVGFVNEWIQNIRTLRILGWISAFEEKIFQVRKIETSNRISMLNNGQTMNAIASSITFVLNVFLVWLLLRIQASSVTPGTLLALLWIVGVFLTRPFRQMPWFFTFVFDSWTSVQRVAGFLDTKNREKQPHPTELQKLQSLQAPGNALQIRGLNYEIGEQKLLSSLDFDVELGEFLAIVGPVGSGKSLLLLSLMGETGATFEQYKIGGNDALKLPLDQIRQFYTFVPQEGFIMSATLRENVVFDYREDRNHDEAIRESLARTQFDLDRERVSDGLDTEIGERGVNLSGGQKQRVSLARVDYFRSPIVLLDDCLSAVDVDTEKKLIRGLLSGAWKDRTRILVTHRLSILKAVDRILFLDQGELKAQGTFASLSAQSAEFREYTASLERTEQESGKNPETQQETEVPDDSERSSDSV